MNLNKFLAEQQKRELEIKADWLEEIAALPNNPKIETISDSPKAFTMSSSNLTGKPWTPFFHNWKQQHQHLIDYIMNHDISSIGREVDMIVKFGTINFTHHSHDKVTFAPEVREQFKKIFYTEE